MDDKNLQDEFASLDREEADRLNRFVEGRSDPDEASAVRQWLAEDPRRGELMRRIHRARVVAGLSAGLWDIDEGWARLVARLGGEEGVVGAAGIHELVARKPPALDPAAVAPATLDSAAQNPAVSTAATPVAAEPGTPVRVLHFRPPQAQSLQHRRGGLGLGLRAAALVAALVGGAMLWQNRATLFAPQAAPLHELATGVGERMRITLADGTGIVLGPATRLWFPEHFGAEREVRLEGEAVFDVATDSVRSFRVLTDAAVTRVLGTRFGVRAYPEDEYVEVVVAEGRVAVAPAGNVAAAGTAHTDSAAAGTSPAGAAPSSATAGPGTANLVPAVDPAGSISSNYAQLTPGQAVRVDRAGTLGSPRAVDAGRLLSWTEGHLVFERAPLSEVARVLQRRYGIEIELADPSVAALRLTAEFLQPGKVAEVVRLISLSLGVEYSKTPNGFLLFHSTPTAGVTRDEGSNR